MKKILTFLLTFLCPFCIFALEIPLDESFAERLLASSYSCDVTSYSTSNNMYCFKNEQTDLLKEVNNYRFIGNASNNYVLYDGEDYRILGVFVTEDKNGNFHNSVKLVKDTFLGQVVYDTTSSNDWANSDIRNYLNTTFYNQLSEDDKKLIQEVKMYLGGIDNTASKSSVNYYTSERTGSDYSYDNISLMYASDLSYTYEYGVNNKCATDGLNCRTIYGGVPSSGYLYNSSGAEWLFTPYSTYILMHGANGFIGNFNIATSSAFYIRPSFYLKDNVRVASGDGSASNPYILDEITNVASINTPDNGNADLSIKDGKIYIKVTANEGYELDSISCDKYDVLKIDSNNYYFEFNKNLGSININVSFKKLLDEPEIEPEKPEFKFREGNNFLVNAYNLEEYKLVIDGNYELFDSLYIDGVKYINGEDYTVTKGSTILTLTDEGINKLKKLENGTHKIVVNFMDGQTIKADLQINNISNPFTFDRVICFIIALILLSTIIFIINKKSKVNLDFK